MEKATAQSLVRNTLKAPFDRKRYHGLVSELCNGFDDGKAIDNMSVPDAFAAHVKSCQRLGMFTSPEGEKADVLVVKLTESWKLERSRTALRDFVAHKLKRDNAYKEAGLIAFVAPDAESWRFSYIRMDYETKRDPQTGKIKTEERLTPARRYSYLVGTDEECHTAQTRFLPLLVNTTTKPTLAQLEEAFSVESVTKEFFNEYARLFKATDEALTAVRDDLAAKGVSTADFAKKLLGQIVFLYFIQKKGWLGVSKAESWGEGPRHFLRQLANQAVADKQCLFNAVLEPLFYDTLATDRGAEAWCPRFKCRIPFLNGGLFEPLAGYDWQQRVISLPNTLFINDKGTGILDVFDRYNFTVNEAEPLEKEVAIDPEMLGKVFENLIEENRRKGLGAFYTPREIVHYMCQESLINYLDTTVNSEIPPNPPLSKGGIKPLARVDIEALIREGEQAAHYETARKDGTVSYQRRLPKAIEENARALDEALRTITVCDPAIGSGAFPVGMMTEIVRARMALTLYFDDATERTAYHFKRHAIQNSLYGVDIDIGAVEIAKLRLWLSLVVDEEDVQQIKPLPNLDYKVVAGNSLLGVEKNLFNDEYFKQLEALKPKFFDESDRAKKTSFKQQIDKLIHTLTKGLEVFDFEIYFSEVFHAKGGFDVVIGNPPYISHDQIVENKKLLFTLFKSYSAFADIYCFFLERAIFLMNKKGTMCFITSNSYIKAEYGANLRSIICKELTLLELLNLEASQVFSDAIVNVAILIASIKRRQKISTVLVSNSSYNSGSFLDYVNAKAFYIESEYLSNKQWSLAKSNILKIRSKIEACGCTIKKLGAKIRLGIATGCNKAFIIDQSKKQQLILSQQKSEEIIVPIIRGKDIKRYSHLNPKVFLIAAKNGINIRKDYESTYDYFLSFGEEFKNRGARGEEWWNLRACAFYDDFNTDRIVWIELAEKARFTICYSGIWCLNSAYFMLPPKNYSINYLLAILNSCVINFYFKLVAQTSGMGVPRWINLYVEQFPIPTATPSEQAELETLVQRILENPNAANVADLEAEINERVYRLYSLTPDEIAVIENV